MDNSSINWGVIFKIFFSFTTFLEEDEIPDFLKAAYCSLVYHIPAGTAHSKDTNLPTIFSSSAKDTHCLVIKSCKIGKCLDILSWGFFYLPCREAHSIAKYVITFSRMKQHFETPKKYSASNKTIVVTTIDLIADWNWSSSKDLIKIYCVDPNILSIHHSIGIPKDLRYISKASVIVW